MNRGTVSKRVTTLITCRRTYAALALMALIASLSGAAAAAPQPGLTPEKELEWKIGAVQRETPEESVRMLIQAPPTLIERAHASSSSTFGGKAHLRRMERDPRVAKLLDLARNGSEAQRDSLLAEVKKMCRHFIEELPMAHESSEDFSPTVFDPRGASAYPLLLSILDDKVETLPLLLEMRDRHVKALRKRLAEDFFREATGIGYEKAEQKAEQTGVSSEFVDVVAYACWELLGKYERTPALRSALSSRHAQILAELAVFNERTGVTDGWIWSNHKNVFQFAQDFVQAADR